MILIYLGLVLCIYNRILVIVSVEKDIFLKFSWPLDGMGSAQWSDMLILNRTLTCLSPSLGIHQATHATCGSVTTWLSFWPFSSLWQLGSAGLQTHTATTLCHLSHSPWWWKQKNSDGAKCPIRIQVLHVSNLWAPLNTSVSPFICTE
jgi:hypothetical protein